MATEDHDSGMAVVAKKIVSLMDAERICIRKVVFGLGDIQFGPMQAAGQTGFGVSSDPHDKYLICKTVLDAANTVLLSAAPDDKYVFVKETGMIVANLSQSKKTENDREILVKLLLDASNGNFRIARKNKRAREE